MNGISMASTDRMGTAAGALGALLGGAADGHGEGQKSPSSFGAALALAERALDAGGVVRVPADAAPTVEQTPMRAATGNRDALEGDVTAATDVPTTPPDEEDAAPMAPDSAAPDASTAMPTGGVLADSAASMVAAAVLPAGPVVSMSSSDTGRSTDAPLKRETSVRGDEAARPRSDAAALPETLAPAEERATGAGVPVPVSSKSSGPTIPAASAAPIARTDAATPPSSPHLGAEVSASVTTAPGEALGRNATSAATDRAPSVVVTPSSSPSAAAPVVAAPHFSAPPAPVIGTEATPSRAVAAQVSPAVLNIVQRPVGSHQLTMTVNPDTLGPVTVRAHISAGGEVRVELLGATDAGREALRTIMTDLRRDLAAVMPHANLTLGSGTAADAGTPDRGAQQGAGGAAGEQASEGRASARTPGVPVIGATARGILDSSLTTAHAVSGGGLDIFA